MSRSIAAAFTGSFVWLLSIAEMSVWKRHSCAGSDSFL